MTELTEAEIERLCSLLATTPPGHLGPWLDNVAAIIDARLAPIRALADEWEHDGGGCAPSWCRICQLRAALDAASAPVSAQQDHDGAEGQGCTCRGMDEAPGCTHGAPRVHNHPPYEPTCSERRVGGQLRGACLNDDGSPR